MDLSDADEEASGEESDEGDDSEEEDEANVPHRKRAKPAPARNRPAQHESGGDDAADQPGPSK